MKTRHFLFNPSVKYLAEIGCVFFYHFYKSLMFKGFTLETVDLVSIENNSLAYSVGMC